MSYDTMCGQTEGETRPAILRIHIPDDNFVWLSANVVAEHGETLDEKTAVEKRNVTLEITEPAFLDEFGTEKRFRDVTLDYGNLTLQNSEKDMPRDGVSDMVALNYLHEASILDNLRRRFQAQKPYTYIGGICVALNPYMWLNMYTPKLQSSYESKLRHELDPHVYSTSAHAYRTLQNFNRNQSVLVSGESGAGKTETVKILMRHIAHISTRTGNKAKPDTTIIQKVLDSNPLLETFGNAKTLRNDNSSRFGKFTQMHLDGKGQLSGSRCLTYLLEKSRVVAQSPGERNYHIFHVVMACPNAMRSKFHLEGVSASDFRYLGGGDTATASIEGILDKDKFDLTMSTLQLVGLDERMRDQVISIVAGILYLGQTSFAGDEDKSQALSTGSVRLTCDLLGLDYNAFCEIMTHRAIIEPGTGKSMSIPLGKTTAATARDALAKECYERLFFWLVGRINASTCAPCDDNSSASTPRTIALLDIFGFENFDVNRFEQLCINFANEKLQQKFTHDFFSVVQQEYKEEGLEWDKIAYKDNRDVLLMFEAHGGLFPLLVEECKRNIADPAGLDKQYLDKVVRAFDKKQPKFFKSMKMNSLDFGVAHYAGDVVYGVSGFMQKNKDALPLEVSSFMQSSSNSLVRTIFHESNDGNHTTGGGGEASQRDAPARTGGRRGSFMLAETVIQKFQRQLQSLMATIGETDVQYVRCVKPNKIKSHAYFDRLKVVEQLRCAGMFEAIRISRAAYPYCILHTEFVERFGLCVSIQWTIESSATGSTNSAQPMGLAERCEKVMRKVLPESVHEASKTGMTNKHYEIGHTKTYFSNSVLTLLEANRYQCAVCVVKIQKEARRWLGVRSFRQVRKCILLVQGVIRMRFAINKAKRRRLAATVIINLLASRYGRRAYLAKRKAATIAASWIRMFLGKIRYATLYAEEKQRKETTTSLEAMKLRLTREATAAAAAEAEKQSLLRELETLRKERNLVRDRPTLEGGSGTAKEGVDEIEVPFARSSSTAEIEAVTSVQGDVARLQRALESALESKKELSRKLDKVKKDAENKVWVQKSRYLEQSELWKKEKAELVRSYMEASQLLDEAQAGQDAANSDLRVALKRIEQLNAEKEEAEEKYILERYAFKRARAEMAEFLAVRGVDPAALVNLSLASGINSSPSIYKGAQVGNNYAIESTFERMRVREQPPAEIAVSSGTLTPSEKTHRRTSTQSNRLSPGTGGRLAGDSSSDVPPPQDDSGRATSRKNSFTASSNSSYTADASVFRIADSTAVGVEVMAMKEKEVHMEKRRPRRNSLRSWKEAVGVQGHDYTRKGEEGNDGERDVMTQIEKIKAEHLKQIELDAVAAAENAFAEAVTPHNRKMRAKRAEGSSEYEYEEEMQSVSDSDEGLVEGLGNPFVGPRDYEDAASVELGSQGSDEETIINVHLPQSKENKIEGRNGIFGVGFFGF